MDALRESICSRTNWLVVLVLLILFVFLASCKRAEAPTPNALAPIAPAAAASADLLNKVRPVIANGGTDSQLSAEMADKLGFTGSAESWHYRQIAVREEQYDFSTPLHMIAISPDATRDAVIYVRRTGASHFIRIDPNEQVVKAVAVDQGGKNSIFIPTVEAQSEVNYELRFWGANAEKAVHWQVCNGSISGAHRVDVDKKIESCTWIIQSGKETPRGVANAYTSRGMAFERGHVPKELEDLNQAIKVDPTCRRAWAQLCGVQNWITGETPLAIQSCSKAIELDPLAPEGWTFRGDIYLKNKNYDLAIADYDHAISLNPNWMWTLDNRGEAHLRKNEIERAIEDFNAVIRVSPDYSMGFLDRGIAEMRKNDMDAALDDFQTGMKVNPHCASCLLGQGLVKRAKGDLAGGDTDIARAKAMTPTAMDGFAEDGIPLP